MGTEQTRSDRQREAADWKSLIWLATVLLFMWFAWNLAHFAAFTFKSRQVEATLVGKIPMPVNRTGDPQLVWRFIVADGKEWDVPVAVDNETYVASEIGRKATLRYLDWNPAAVDLADQAERLRHAGFAFLAMVALLAFKRWLVHKVTAQLWRPVRYGALNFWWFAPIYCLASMTAGGVAIKLALSPPGKLDEWLETTGTVEGGWHPRGGPRVAFVFRDEHGRTVRGTSETDWGRRIPNPGEKIRVYYARNNAGRSTVKSPPATQLNWRWVSICASIGFLALSLHFLFSVNRSWLLLSRWLGTTRSHKSIRNGERSTTWR